MSVGSSQTMPPQFELTPWASPPCLPCADDSNSLDYFNMLEELSLNLNIDETPLSLFSDSDALLPDVDIPDAAMYDMMEDLLGVLKPKDGEVRHDCMWAGACVDHAKHTISSASSAPAAASVAAVSAEHRPDPEERLRPSPVKSSVNRRDTVREVPQTSVPQAQKYKSHQRSLLRTNVVSNVSDQTRTASQDDSDDSGRPETPQSLSPSEAEAEGEDEAPIDFAHDSPLSLSGMYRDVEDDSEPRAALPVSEVTGQKIRATASLFDSPASMGHVSRYDTKPQQPQQQPQTVIPPTYHIADHSYHLSKNDVSASIPGNLTPSDSEDEIDVVSVYGEKGAHAHSASSRSSSQGALPTNPSARDRHALQQTIATMSSLKKAYPYSHMRSGTGGKLERMQAERRIAERERKLERKRRAQERDDSSEEDRDLGAMPTKKRAKLNKFHARNKSFKVKRHLGHGHSHGHHSSHSSHGHSSHASRGSSGSSDSEPDSCEKRSLHNNMERQRRVDLRNAFEDLRVVVPTLSPNPRAAKVVILKEASQYCHQLTADSRCMQQETNALERERERLLARVSYLRKELASRRSFSK